MGLRDLGFHFVEEEDREVIVMFIIDGDTRETLYQPTQKEIEETCVKYKLSFEKLMELLNNRSWKVHTLFINAPVFRGDIEE